MQKLETLAHPNDNPDLVHNACHYVGWQVLNPKTWEYIDIWIRKRGIVTIPKLIKAVQAKRDRISDRINPKVVSINKFANDRSKPSNKSRR